MNEFYIDYVGCEKRKLDTEKIIQYMLENGYERKSNINDLNKNSVIIFVSCAFNNQFSELSKTKIKTILREKRADSDFVLSGCLPEIEPEFLEENGIYNSCGPRNLEALDDILSSKIKMNSIPEQNISCFDNIEYPKPNTVYRSTVLEEYIDAKNYYKIRASWGCVNNCSYCVIKKATKNLKSKQLNEIEYEMIKGIEDDYDKFFFTGGDLGAYGVDIGTNVVRLLELITSFKGVNIYLQEFNVQWIIRYGAEISDILLKNKANYSKLFINCPIQSGSNQILKKMNRPYIKENVLSSLNHIRKNNHKITLGSHFIVGFPGESEEDFDDTRQLIDELDLDFIMVFPYSEHPNAESAKFENKIPLSIAEERCKKLLDLQYVKDLKNNRFCEMKNLNITDIHKIANDIEGWLTPTEGEVLFNLAKNVPRGSVVEIGSWKGKSTFYLACGILQRGEGFIYSIDHHTGSFEHRNRTDQPINTLNEFCENMRTHNVGHVIRTLVMNSIDASKQIHDEIGLIFVDGSHDYGSVRSDFETWWPKLMEGGIIAFHDSLSKEGVSKYVDEIISTGSDFEFPQLIHEITYIKKSSHIGCITKKEIEDFKAYKEKMLDKLISKK